jgi:hypothetical protein
MPARSDQHLLTALLDEMFWGPAWHGPALRGAIRGVDARAAVKRPAPGAHNVAELVVHAAYWKYVVRRRITGDESLMFPIGGHNFIARDRLTPRAWREDIALLEAEHALLVEAVSALPAKRLAARLGKSPAWTVRQTIQGAAAHDVYHAGQIRLIRKIVERRKT